MAGETDLGKLLASMKPVLQPEEYVFCSTSTLTYKDLEALNPMGCYQEGEGMSLILQRAVADTAGFKYDAVFRAITLSVHSSLEAVGFTAAIAGKLAEHNISANIVAAHYHDHLFVPAEKVNEALQLLQQFEGSDC
ncbi:MAG: transporter [SAR86 cluster bacterium]|uniref:Transporter n=1 Tax=SAR86 cluster bacterium TaxID=2030880 RepID=A0A2A5ABX5_9GAMM|nr:MAG: transporter [SAR86 cluster bacterium]